jgi:hypothetical protein
MGERKRRCGDTGRPSSRRCNQSHAIVVELRKDLVLRLHKFAYRHWSGELQRHGGRFGNNHPRPDPAQDRRNFTLLFINIDLIACFGPA